MAFGERDVRLNVIIDEDGRGAREAANDLERIARGADKASGSLGNLGRSTSRVDADIQKHKASIKALAEEYERTGNVDLFRNIRKDERAVRNLEKIRKEITGIESAGLKLSEVFTDASGFFGKALEKIAASPELAIGGAAIGGAVASAILAAISGAALTATAGAAIAGGIVLAFRSAEVKAAWTSFGTSMLKQLTDAASSFQQPLIQAARIFETAFAGVMPQVKADFATLAPLIEKLARGAAGFVQALMPGLGDAFKAAVPIVQSFAQELPRIGEALSSMFSDMAKGGKGAGDAFILTIRTLEAGVAALGGVLREASVLFEVFGGGALRAASDLGVLNVVVKSATSSGLVAWLGDLIHKTDETKQKTLDLNKAYAILKSDGFHSTTEEINSFAQEWTDKLLTSTLAVDQATLGFDRSLITVGDTLTKNQGSLTEHVKMLKKTQTGEMENRQAILDAVGANLRQYDALMSVGMSAEDAAAKYDENTKSLEDQMRQAGMTKQEIDGLIGKYRGVPSRVTTTIAMEGLQRSIEDLEDTMRLINNLPSRKVITVEEIHRTTYVGSTPPSQYFRGLAKGGVVAAAKGMVVSSPTVIFGERQTGKEAYIPMRGIPAATGLELADTAARWHGGMVVPQGSAGTGVIQEHKIIVEGTGVLTGLRKEIRVRGGNVQIVLGT